MAAVPDRRWWGTKTALAVGVGVVGVAKVWPP